MSSLKEVGRKLCSLCNEGKFEEAMNSLYANDAVQVEGMACPSGPSRETKGLDAIRKMGEEWMAHTEVHGQKVSGPYFFEPDRFACTMWLDCTSKDGPMQGRHQMEEVCVYTVKDGKITRAEFFYDMPEM